MSIDRTVELLRDQLRQATARAEAAEAALARAQALQRGAEAQHFAALARVGELEGHLAQWQAIARENAEEVDEARSNLDKAEAKLERAREALRPEERMAQGFDSLDHLRAARLVADRARRAALSDEEEP